LGEIGINPPIPGLVGMGQGVPGNLSPNAKMIKFGLGCPQASLDISQALPVGKLGKSHAQVLVPAGKAFHLEIAIVLIDAFSELVCGDKIHQLRKDRFPGIHVPSPLSLMQETGTSEKIFSNR
jgi:hypothetical protein